MSLPETEIRAYAKILEPSLRVKLKKLAASASKDVLEELGVEDISLWSASRQTAWIEKAAETWAETTIRRRYAEPTADAIANHLDEWGEHIRKTLATPEGLRATGVEMGTQVESFGRHDAAKAAGAATKTWVTTSHKPRDTHKALNGVEIPTEAKFSNGLRWPGDKGPPSETENCQCVLTYNRPT